MRRSGFSLVEVLFATALFCVMMLAIAALLPSALSAARKSQYVLSATNVAQEAVENASSASFDSVAAFPDHASIVDGVTYHASLDVVTSPPVNGRSYLKTLTIHVWWDVGDPAPTQFNTPVVLSTQLYRVVR